MGNNISSIENQHIRNWKNSNPALILDLSNLGIKSLPPIPNNVKILDCHGNLLTELPKNLPNSITKLYCDHNDLKYLPDNLPSNLEYLYCQNNNLKCLPNNLSSNIIFLHP
jgi:Leucine-rich repeat (LRR) protein